MTVIHLVPCTVQCIIVGTFVKYTSCGNAVLGMEVNPRFSFVASLTT